MIAYVIGSALVAVSIVALTGVKVGLEYLKAKFIEDDSRYKMGQAMCIGVGALACAMMASVLGYAVLNGLAQHLGFLLMLVLVAYTVAMDVAVKRTSYVINVGSTLAAVYFSAALGLRMPDSELNSAAWGGSIICEFVACFVFCFVIADCRGKKRNLAANSYSMEIPKEVSEAAAGSETGDESGEIVLQKTKAGALNDDTPRLHEPHMQ